MGIPITDDVLHFLKMKSAGRDRRLLKTKTKEFKTKRRKHEFEKIKQESADAHKARAKREGVYKSGIGMDGGYTQADLDIAQQEQEQDDAAANDNQKPAASTHARKKSNKKACVCGATDHQRTSSRLCKLYGKKKAKGQPSAATGAETNAELKIDIDSKEMADEMDAMDSLALTGADEDTYYSDNNAANYSSDDDGFFSANSEFS